MATNIRGDRVEGRTAGVAAAGPIAVVVYLVCLGCSGGDSVDAPSHAEADTVVADTSSPDVLLDVLIDIEPDDTESVPDLPDPDDTSSGADVSFGGDAVNPGCVVPATVVQAGFAVEVEVDLTSYASREYPVTQRIVVQPSAAGEAISLYGVSLSLGSASAPYQYDGNLVTFCTGAFAAGETVEVDVQFVISEAQQGFPPGSLAGMRVWGPDSGDFVVGPYTSPFFASTWLLAPQTMTWFNASHDGNVVAQSVLLRVVVPGPEWMVIGPSDAKVEGNTWTFEVDQAMPLYTLSFAASPSYELLEAGSTGSGVTLTAGVTPASKQKLKDNLEVAAVAVDWMTAHVGDYPWGSRLAFAEVPGFGGGMEHTGAIWMGSNAIDGGKTGDYVAAHEVVHHWWGNYVRIADWPDFWLSEGLTEWTTIFAILETTLDQPAVESLQTFYRQQAAESSYPKSPNAPLPGPLRFDDSSDIMTQVSNNLLFFYYYGAVFLEMVDQRLVRNFGTDLATVLPAWYQGYGGGAASTEDFMMLLADHTGTVESWEQLFAEWVYQGPAPTLQVGAYSFVDGDAKLTLTRTGGADQDLSALEVAFVQGGTSVVAMVSLPSGSETVDVQAATSVEPETIVIDPNGFYILRVEAEPGYGGPKISP